MSNDPTLYSTQAAKPLESVSVEVDYLPDGRPCYNVKASAIQHSGAIWERVVQILLEGLRASLAQTLAPHDEARIVQPSFLLPPSSDR